MSRFVIFWIFILIFISITEVYFYQGIKTAFQNPVYRKIGWAFQFISLLVVIATIIMIFTSFKGGLSNASLFNNIMMGLMFTFIITKLVFVFFPLTEDIFRGVKWIAQKVFSSSETVSLDSRRSFISKIGLATAAIPLAGLSYGALKGKYSYKTHRLALKFKNLPKAFDGLKIVQISDMHSGSFDNVEVVGKAIKSIQDLNPDLILFTGDLVNNVAEEVDPFIPFMKELSATYGKYSVLGNHDYGGYYRFKEANGKEKNFQRLQDKHREMGFNLLMNQHEYIHKGEDKIAILGVENWGLPPFPQKGDLNKVVNGIQPNDFSILLSHDPTHWDQKVIPHSQHIPLTLSGHTHGFQMGIEIPGVIKWSPSKWRYKKWAGLYTENEQHLYINRGFGFLGYPGRIGIWPEITLIELQCS